MTLYKQNTESALKNKLDAIRNDPTGWLAAVFSGRVLSTAKKRLLFEAPAQKQFLTLMQTEGVLPYFFRDGDIAFLYQGMRSHTLDEIKGIISSIFPEFTPDNVNLDASFRCFIVSEDMKNLDALIERKMLEYQSKKEKFAGYTSNNLPSGAARSWSPESFIANAAARATRTKPVILVVEDDPLLIELSRAVLRKGYDVHTASTVQDALHLYSRYAPDLVFMDIQMPDGNGLALLQFVLKQDIQSKVIMFSSHKTEGVIKKALELGAHGYVTKPFKAESLLLQASRALKN